MDGESALRKATIYKGDHKTEKCRHTSMPRAGFKPTIPMFERLKTIRALDRAAGGTGSVFIILFKHTIIRFIFSVY